MLRNVRLTEELKVRLDELKAAQKRLVTAQDEERRRLERNIHDGAQQQLVALAVKLKLAEQLIERDPAKAQRDRSRSCSARRSAALEDLRDLARGIYPPLLADKGLAAALEAQARKSAVPVHDRSRRRRPVPAGGRGRRLLLVPRGAAERGEVRRGVRGRRSAADGDGDALRSRSPTTVADSIRRDDGHGTGLQGIADRLGALDGTLQVHSAAGEGATIVGAIPVEPAARSTA